MARYHTGARAEYKLKHELEKKGWHVIRAAGSHGKWDLVAVRKRNGRVDVLLIQVKRRQPPKKPIATFYRNCSVLDCFVFFAPRKGSISLQGLAIFGFRFEFNRSSVIG
jgi:Holliday junction resolvase